MNTHIDLLKELINGGIIPLIDQNSDYDILVIEEMYNSGLLEAVEHRPYSGVKYLNVKINMAGREWFVENTTTIKWYHSFSNRISVIGVIATLVGLAIAVIALG